jgi:hypothetical protein
MVGLGEDLAMHHLLIIAVAFAFAAVTPYIAGPGPGADAGYSADADEALQPGESEPDGE